MRILIIYSYRGWGGTLAPLLKIGGGLSELGHDVHVVCHPRSETLSRVAADPRFGHATAAIRSEANPLPALRLAAVVRRVRPDLVLCDRRKDVKYSLAARGLDGAFPIVHNHEAPSPLKDGPLYRFVWGRIQTVIVNSYTLRDSVLATAPWLAKLRLEVIHTGKDVNHYRPRPELRARLRGELGIPAKAFVVSFHGAIQARKNIDTLIRAVGRLPRDLDVHTLIVGSGPQLAELKEEAARLGVSATFTGTRGDVPELLSASDVAVHLSSAEGFANSVTEAMACGLPVIASDATSHREQIEHGTHGFLVPLGSVEGVAEAVRRLAVDAEMRTRIGRMARERVAAEFGWDRMIERYDAVLRETAESFRST